MNNDLKLSVLLLFFCIFLWFYAIPYHIKGTLQALVPRGLTLSMMVPCVLLFINGLSSARAGIKHPLPDYQIRASLTALAIVPMMFVYLFLTDILGFYVTTSLFIFIFMLYFKAKKSISFYLFPIAVPLIVYVIIGRILHFPFPEGLFF